LFDSFYVRSGGIFYFAPSGYGASCGKRMNKNVITYSTSIVGFAADEKVEGEVLQEWLNGVVAPMELAAFIRGESLPQYQSQPSLSVAPLRNGIPQPGFLSRGCKTSLRSTI
jgi:hypothetical protein